MGSAPTSRFKCYLAGSGREEPIPGRFRVSQTPDTCTAYGIAMGVSNSASTGVAVKRLSFARWYRSL